MKSRILKKFNKENLINFLELIKDTNIEYTIFYGTLLGFHRCGDVLDNDDDIDFLINREHYNKVIELINNNPSFGNVSIKKENTFLQIVKMYGKVKTHIDLYFYEDKGDIIVDKWSFGGTPNIISSHLHIPKELFKLKEIGYEGAKVNIINDSKKMCEFLYGVRFNEPLVKNVEYYSGIVNNTPKITYNVK